MRTPIDQGQNPARDSVSPAAWCIHCILTSTSYRKRGGPDNAQASMLKACETKISATDRSKLLAMGHRAYGPKSEAA